MNLNPGGIIGALLGGLIVGIVVFTRIDPDTATRGEYRAPILGFVGGAFAGNFLWDKLVSKSADKSTDAPEED